MDKRKIKGERNRTEEKKKGRGPEQPGRLEHGRGLEQAGGLEEGRGREEERGR